MPHICGRRMRYMEKYSLDKDYLTVRAVLLQRRARPTIRWCHALSSYDETQGSHRTSVCFTQA
jgi:hypothetical protein